MSRQKRRSGDWLPADGAGLGAAEAEVHCRVLGEAVDYFRGAFPEKWEMLRLCPLQHGLETISEMLRTGLR
jgi:hypothetical protein